MNLLPWTIHLCFLGAAVMAFLPRERASWARWLALGVAAATLGVGLVAGACYDPARDGLVTLVRLPWIPQIHSEFHLAADGISLTLVVLTGLASVAGVLFSWNISHRRKEFFALYLALVGGVFGVFLSMDVLLFFVFYEIAIIPKYFLIAIWGSTNREYGAMKLALYSFVGSAMVLVGLIVVLVTQGTCDLAALVHSPLPATSQAWLFPLVFLGFAILAGLWPFHTWAPTGHVAAPTAASMLLAGVVMKLGAYGCLRVAMTLFPEGLVQWQMPMAVLAGVGIVWGAFVALVQDDFKFVIGYSSVSHMGFVMLGLMTLGLTGLTGAILQMFSHGIIAGLLFAVVGRMVYERTHTRDLAQLEAMALGRRLPWIAGAFVLAGLASMGMPGFSGFVAELAVLQGTWSAFPGLAVVGGLGVLLAAAYTLRAAVKAFFGDKPAPESDAHEAFEALTWPEIAGVCLLLASTVWVGLCPGRIWSWIEAGLRTDLMQGLWKGGAS